MKNLKGIKICIEPEKVREYYEAEKDRLSETMDIVAKSELDDADKACFLFVTNENDKMFLSLESPDEIVDSWINPTTEEIETAIIRLSEISAENFEKGK